MASSSSSYASYSDYLDSTDSENILGGELHLDTPQPTSSIFRQMGTTTIILCLALVIALYIGAVHTWENVMRWKEKRYKLSMRRRHGIPDTDHRPFNVAYAAVTRAARQSQALQSVTDIDQLTDSDTEPGTPQLRNRFTQNPGSLFSGANKPTRATGSPFPPIPQQQYTSNAQTQNSRSGDVLPRNSQWDPSQVSVDGVPPFSTPVAARAPEASSSTSAMPMPGGVLFTPAIEQRGVHFDSQLHFAPTPSVQSSVNSNATAFRSSSEPATTISSTHRTQPTSGLYNTTTPNLNNTISSTPTSNKLMRRRKRSLGDSAQDFDSDSLEAKKTRVEGDELIDGTEDAAWAERSTKTQLQNRQAKRKGSAIPNEDREKRARRGTRQQLFSDEDGEEEDMDVDERLVDNTRIVYRGKKREADEDADESLDKSPSSNARRKRRNNNSGENAAGLEVKRGKKRERESIGGAGRETVLSDSDEDASSSRRSQKTKGAKRAKGRRSDNYADDSDLELVVEEEHEDEGHGGSDVSMSDEGKGSNSVLTKGRRVGEQWESSGVRFKVVRNSKGEKVRMRQALVKRARSRFVMPKDSVHPDREAHMEVYVETWMTEEEYTLAKERQLLAWQDPAPVKQPATVVPDTPGDVQDSPSQRPPTGKPLLWSESPSKTKNKTLTLTSNDNLKDSYRQSIATNLGLRPRLNPFQQSQKDINITAKSLPSSASGLSTPTANSPSSSSSLVGLSRSISSGRVTGASPVDSLSSSVNGIASTPTGTPNRKKFSKWEKQDLEAEAMRKMRMRSAEKGKLESSSSVAASTSMPAASASTAFGIGSSSAPLAVKPAAPAASAAPTTPLFSLGAPKADNGAAASAPGVPPTSSSTPAAASNPPPLFGNKGGLASAPPLGSSTPSSAPAAPTKPSPMFGGGLASAPPTNSASPAFNAPSSSTTKPAAAMFLFPKPSEAAKPADAPKPTNTTGGFSFPQTGGTPTAMFGKPSETVKVADAVKPANTTSGFSFPQSGGTTTAMFGKPAETVKAADKPASSTPAGAFSFSQAGATTAGMFAKPADATKLADKQAAPSNVNSAFSFPKAGETTTGNAFGQPPKTTAAPKAPDFFGNNNPSSSTSTNQNKPASTPALAQANTFNFGNPTPPSVFGGMQGDKKADAPSAGGSLLSRMAPASAETPETTASTPFSSGSGSVFGGAANTASNSAPKPTSAFGSTPTTSLFKPTSAFGAVNNSSTAASTPASSSTPPIFDFSNKEKPVSSGMSSLAGALGNPTANETTSRPMKGVPATSHSAFGTTSAFGASKTPTTTASNASSAPAPPKFDFGMGNKPATTSAFGSASSNPFGGGSNVFGGGGASTFGSATNPPSTPVKPTADPQGNPAPAKAAPSAFGNTTAFSFGTPSNEDKSSGIKPATFAFNSNNPTTTSAFGPPASNAGPSAFGFGAPSTTFGTEENK